MTQLETPFLTIECRSIADIIGKYTSKECRMYYSRRMCEYIIEANRLDEGDPSATIMHAINSNANGNIDCDVDIVLGHAYGDLTSYLADMVQKGVVQMLPPSTIKQLRKKLNAITELGFTFRQRKQKCVILDECDFDPTMPNQNIAEGTKQFRLNTSYVTSILIPLGRSINQLTREFYELITNGMFDTLSQYDQSNQRKVMCNDDFEKQVMDETCATPTKKKKHITSKRNRRST